MPFYNNDTPLGERLEFKTEPYKAYLASLSNRMRNGSGRDFLNTFDTCATEVAKDLGLEFGSLKSTPSEEELRSYRYAENADFVVKLYIKLRRIGYNHIELVR